MDIIKCEVCGRPRKGITDVQWDLEYGVFLCKDCRKQVQETKKNLFGREFTDYREFIKEVHKCCHRIVKEEEPMKVKVRRDELKEIEIEVDVNELQVHDKFDISKGGEVIATGTVFDAWTGVDGTYRIDATISFKKESKTWKDLGYNCFEDMIDDIAKEHGSLHGVRGYGLDEPAKFIRNEVRIKWLETELTPAEIKWIKDMYRDCAYPNYKNPDGPVYMHNSNDRTPPYIKIHDAAHEGKKYVLADTFGKSIIRVINKDGSSSIYDAEMFQVYLEEEDNDKSIDEEDD